MDGDVLVVGAGLAGLRCAAVLSEAGLETVVLEAGDAVGGRIRTDRVGGFRCDRGFQLLNPAYPAVRRVVDVDRLGLQPFTAGVACRRDTGLRVVADPRRAPGRLAATLRSGLLDPREVAALLRWVGPTLARPRHAQRHDDGRTLTQSLDAAGVRGPLRSEVLEPFLAGVLADASGQTSAGFVRLLVRSFLLGTPGLPREGMQALPEQLAAPIRDRVRLGARVTGVGDHTGRATVTTEGGALTARAVVVAVGPDQFGVLTGQPSPATQPLTTWWFGADEAPYSRALLTVDGRTSGRRGPVQHAAVVSNAASTYAPPGRHLVQATCLAGHGGAGADDEVAVRQHLAELWGRPTRDWDLLVRHEIPHALPFQSAPLRVAAEPRIGRRVYAAGDHRDTASIQGALASGERIARAVLADLR